MLENEWIEYWPVPALLFYIVAIVMISRRGIPERTKQKVGFATACVLILSIPFMHPPLAHIYAVVAVLTVWVWASRAAGWVRQTDSEPTNP